MASIVYAVSGAGAGGKWIRRRFKEVEHKAAKDFAKSLQGPKITYEVRTRINGRQVSKNFERKIDAERWGNRQEADKDEGKSIDPRDGKVTVGTYARKWLDGRKNDPTLGETTWELYDHYLTKHIIPGVGTIPVASLTMTAVRNLWAGIAKDHPSTAAKVYRLLRQIMNAAVEDRMRHDNPCRIKGAGEEPESDRPSASIAELDALVKAMPGRLKLTVLLAAWLQLRRGELLGLRRRDIHLEVQELWVRKNSVLTLSRKQIVKAPKSRAGKRELSIPDHVMAAIEVHLDLFVKGPDAPLFDCTAGELRRAWERARESINRPELHMHDLRGTGLTLAAIAGATTAELMYRAGHSTPAMAMRYQRATKGRDKLLAGALTDLVRAADSAAIDALRDMIEQDAAGAF